MFNVCFDANTAFLLFVLIVNVYHYIIITWFLTYFWPILNLKWSKISNFFTIKQLFRPLGCTWRVIDFAKVFCLSNRPVKYSNLPYKSCWNSDFGNYLVQIRAAVLLKTVLKMLCLSWPPQKKLFFLMLNFIRAKKQFWVIFHFHFLWQFVY